MVICLPLKEMDKAWPHRPPDDHASPTSSTTERILLPLVSTSVKLGLSEQAVFRSFALGVPVELEEWAQDRSRIAMEQRLRRMGEQARQEHRNNTPSELPVVIRQESIGRERRDPESRVIELMKRPYGKLFVHRGAIPAPYHDDLLSFAGSDGQAMNTFMLLSSWGGERGVGVGASAAAPYPNYAGTGRRTLVIPMYTTATGRGLKENVTTWGLEAFRAHYGPLMDPALRRNGIHRVPTSLARVRAARAQGLKRREDLPEPPGTAITTADVFHYVYAVLNDPIFQEQHSERLATGQPSIPLYPDFRRWRDHGRQLLQLHIGYEMIEPWPLDVARMAVPLNGKKSTSKHTFPRIKVDRGSNSIELDVHVRIQDIPREAWDHRIGDRSALEWVAEHFQDRSQNVTSVFTVKSDRGPDHLEQAIQLLRRVCRVSVETQRLVRSMANAER
jgi:hypothetical protein